MKTLTSICGNIRNIILAGIWVICCIGVTIGLVFASSGGSDYEKKFIVNLLIRAGYTDSLIVELAEMPRELVTYDADSGFVINLDYTHIVRDEAGNPVAGIIVMLKDITMEKNIKFLFNLVEERNQKK